MSDTNTTQTVTVAPPDLTKTLTPLTDDLQKDIALGIKVVQAFKSGGIKAATALLPEVVDDAKQTYEDVEVALPVIKAGYKTTEFWLVTGWALMTAGFAAFGHPLPDAVVGASASLVAIYTGFRTQTKTT